MAGSAESNALHPEAHEGIGEAQERTGEEIAGWKLLSKEGEYGYGTTPGGNSQGVQARVVIAAGRSSREIGGNRQGGGGAGWAICESG